MSRGAKIGLAIAAGVMALCCIVSLIGFLVVRNTVQRAVTTDPDRAAEIGREIADYARPRGYEEKMGMTILGMKIVALGPRSETQGPLILMLMQFPAALQMSQEEMERQMRESWEGQGGQRYEDFRVVGTQQTTVRGRPVTLTVSEGRSEGGEPIRQVVGAFAGKGERMVLFMAMGAQASWDWGVVDEFLGSIR